MKTIYSNSSSLRSIILLPELMALIPKSGATYYRGAYASNNNFNNAGRREMVVKFAVLEPFFTRLAGNGCVNSKSDKQRL